MIKKIAHLGDIHIKKSLDRHQEYREVFSKLYDDLKKEKPDRIVVVGDIYDNFIDIEGESLILMGEFLNNLSNISKTILTRGNHDIRKKHKTRVDTIETITTLLKDTGITYYNKSGFYEDENVTWVVWDHVDEINPWKHFNKRNTKDRIYIDLYHNPINGCELYNGMIVDGKYPKISDFKADYSMFSDIHLRQFFKNKTKAFVGSLIQQNFGELPEKHGYLLWDIETGEVKEKDIHNDYKFINININKDTDYNNLKLNTNIEKSDKIKVKVKWEDYSAYMNTENEKKIRDLIKENIGSEFINIENRPLYTDITDSQLISDTIDINDVNIQKNLLIEFLSANKIDQEVIDKIIDIDNEINQRLDIKISKNIKWNINKIWFNNFKSYGNNNEIDLENMNGIIQIHGINQQGKSTILDAICYILYGTTLSTQKREKHGDNRYINNKKKLNYADGGAIIEIDGEKYLIYRKTERKIKKDKSIFSCSTNLEYYKGTEMKEENKLVGENRIKTQQDIDSILGDFNDFIRLTLTNADNINELLSMDRSVFIDNIIRDAGYDVFEKKLAEFKDYKKSLNLDRINININSVNKEIETINEIIEINKKEIEELNEKISSIEKSIKDEQESKEKLISEMYKIDDELMKIDYEELINQIETIDNSISYDYQEISRLESEISDLSNEFDKDSLSKKREWYDKYRDALNDIKNEIIAFENKINTKKYELKTIDSRLIEKKYEIEKNLTSEVSKYESKINVLNSEIANIKKEGFKLKNQILSLENSSGETKICPTCLKPLTDDDTEHFQNEILKTKQELKDLALSGKSKMNEIDFIKEKIYDLKSKKIEDNVDYIEFFNDIQKEKESINQKIEEYENKISKRKERLERVEPKIDEVKLEIIFLEKEKESYDRKIKIESKIKDIKIDIETRKSNNLKEKEKLGKYIENKTNIDKNNEIESNIKEINKRINEVEISKKDIENKKSLSIKNLILKNRTIEEYQEKIEKYKKQEELEFVHNTYMKSMHRDGLPTYLLKKSIHIINNELITLLSNVDFILLFNDDLNLKMKSKIDNVIYNAVEGSGMERTFNACALKMALRKINNTSKPNFILFDEIMNKLVDKSVENFSELLYELKSHIDRILIIEHIHQIKYDYIISVEKDKKGVSSFEIY
jgi:DNA repair exonuclease SbcCD ATPase subunit